MTVPLIAQVRDRTLARVGILTEDDLATLKLFPARNDVATWELTLPHMVRSASGQWVRHAMAEELTKPGAGVVVDLPGGRRFSGPVLVPAFTESTDDTRGTWSFTGVSDTIALADRLAFPDPTVADAQESSASSAYDTRTAPAETLMHEYVAANIGPDATSSRRNVRLVMGPDGGRGTSRTKAARFANLLELCQELAAVDGLCFDIVQRGDELVFETWASADLTASVRMDVASDSLAEAKYAYSGPRASSVVVLGQGEAEERAIRTRTAPEADELAEAWGRYIEVVVDARGSETPEELDAKGDEVLAEAGGVITSLDVTPSAVNASTLGLDWWVGDLVTVNVAGVPVKAAVTRIRIEVTTSGIFAAATVGNAVGFDPDRVTGARVSSVESRVSSLERNAEGGASAPVVELPPPLPAPRAVVGPSSSALTSTTFENLPGIDEVTLTLDAPLYVRVDLQCIITDNAASYTMIGVAVSGDTTIGEIEPGLPGSIDSSAYTPFGYSAGALAGCKVIRLNAGTSTIRFRRRRNGTSGTNITNYALMQVTPIAWA